ncbi:hypothetical protein ElyMa_003442200 [Elysia marginata]|uniref:RRM domain-containing protein n=1 Tax=Elysia marginata TaxID=1093978 RepID=A0AAV4JT15_9GAST|nr:hypothetical protein ElyMa_003442200 [Elysia marginata]
MVTIAKIELNELSQYSRRCNIRIFGIRDNNNTEWQEQTRELVCNIFKNKLKVNLSANSIDKVHRVGKFQSGADRAVIVRFTSHSAAEQVLAGRRVLKGTGLTITKDLTKANNQRLRKVKALEGVQQAWTKSGEIFVKDIHDRLHRFFPGDSVGDLNVKIAKQPQHAANKRQYMYRDRQSTERTSNSPPLYERSSTRSPTRNGVTNTDTQECREPPLQPRTSTPSENSDVNKETTQKTPIQKKLQELVSNEEERSHPPQKHTDKTPIGPLDHWVTTPTEGQRSETTKAKRHM